ncbi:MAG: hypothetical protein ACYTFG_17825, partial [Planctomycetota bacterium]
MNGLRILAVLGFVLPPIVGAFQSLDIKSGEYAFGVLVIQGLAVLAMAAVLLQNPVKDLVENPDLLVPVGVALLASSAVSWLSLAPGFAAVLAPSETMKFLGLTLTVSLAFFIHIGIWVAFAAWQTRVIWTWVRTGRKGEIDP